MDDGAKKAAGWNPGLSTKTNRPVGRPKKRWEDKINDFLKPEETEETQGNEIQRYMDHQSGQDRDTWKEMESEYAKTAAAASVDSVRSRRYSPQDPIRPARYLNGVKLDEYEVVNIAWPLTKDQTDFD